MTDRKAKRAGLVERLADVVLAEGLDALALRPAAARLGTSDRMLLYYFGTKAALVEAVLAAVSARLAARLTAVPGDRPRTPAALVDDAVAMLADSAARPVLRLWFEIVGRAARDDAVFGRAARRLVEEWLAWIDARLDLPPGSDRRGVGLAVLAVVDGLSALDLVMPGAAAAGASGLRVQ